MCLAGYTGDLRVAKGLYLEKLMLESLAYNTRLHLLFRIKASKYLSYV